MVRGPWREMRGKRAGLLGEEADEAARPSFTRSDSLYIPSGDIFAAII